MDVQSSAIFFPPVVSPASSPKLLQSLFCTNQEGSELYPETPWKLRFPGCHLFRAQPASVLQCLCFSSEETPWRIPVTKRPTLLTLFLEIWISTFCMAETLIGLVFHSGCGATQKCEKKDPFRLLKHIETTGLFWIFWVYMICLICMCPTSLACYTWQKLEFQAAKQYHPYKMWSKPIQQFSTPQKKLT